jgi:hypothetical protein
MNKDIPMDTTLQLTRPFRVADLARPYQIVLDGEAGGRIGTLARAELPIAAGSHTLQIDVPRLLIFPGLSSPPRTFDIDSGQTVKFVCHPPKFLGASWLKYLACLLGARDWWIELESAR